MNTKLIFNLNKLKHTPMKLENHVKDRMEGLSSIHNIRKFRYSIEDIIENLYNEGFEVEDIKMFLIEQMDEFIEELRPTK